MEAFMYNIKFNPNDFEIICHSRYSDKTTKIKNLLKPYDLKNHLVIFSSGTTSNNLKGYALSKEALLANAEAVNKHFNLTSKDIWGLSLPHYHVGGLSVILRSQLLNNKLISLGPWEPKSWHQALMDNQITITTVVPTQIFDLVQLGLKAPPMLKYLVVGGDFLSEALEEKVKALGWPIIRTFGMTEVCSQLASGKTAYSKQLEILPIHQVKIDNGRLMVKSQSLFTLQFVLKEKGIVNLASEFTDTDGYYLTNDTAEVSGNLLTPLGRLDDQIKMNGRLISLLSLKEKLFNYLLEKNLFGKMELALVDDEREGKKVYLLHTPETSLSPELQNLFHPLKIYSKEVASFERTDLGKLKLSKV